MASIGERLSELSKTPAGRIAVVAVPVAILAMVLALVALTMLRSGGPDGAQPIATTPNNQSSSTVSAGGSTTPAPSAAEPSPAATETLEPLINEDFEVYETRDPFKPVETSSTTGPIAINATGSQTTSQTQVSAGDTSSSAQGQAQTLALETIDDANGVLYANVSYGGQSYTLRPGDRVGASSFQLASIAADSATFLYGDDPLTLRPGESVDK